MHHKLSLSRSPNPALPLVGCFAEYRAYLASRHIYSLALPPSLPPSPSWLHWFAPGLFRYGRPTELPAVPRGRPIGRHCRGTAEGRWVVLDGEAYPRAGERCFETSWPRECYRLPCVTLGNRVSGGSCLQYDPKKWYLVGPRIRGAARYVMIHPISAKLPR